MDGKTTSDMEKIINILEDDGAFIFEKGHHVNPDQMIEEFPLA